MPRDASGNYTLPIGNPVSPDTVIQSEWANSTLSDIALQLNNVITRDGLLGPIGTFRLADGTIAQPGLGFISEPGLGLFREGSSQIGWAAAGAKVMGASFNPATQTTFGIWPRAAGSSAITLFNAPASSANFGAISLGVDPSGIPTISNPIGGTGTAQPLNINLSVMGLNSLAGDSAQLFLNKPASGLSNILSGRMNNVNRWSIILGNSTAEGGTSTGSDFQIIRYNNAGVGLSTPLVVARETGAIAINGNTTLTGTFLATQSITSQAAVVGTGFQSPSSALYMLTPSTFQNTPPYRFQNIAWSNSAASGFGADLGFQFIHQPGTMILCRISVQGSFYDMRETGQGSSSGGWVATSDRAVKDHIEPIENALYKVLSLNGCTFDKLDMSVNGVAPRKAGYIAQDVRAVLPEAIVTMDGGTLAVDHNAVIGLLINAVKELNHKVESHAFRPH